MQLALATWPEVEEYLRRARGIVLPIGSTEQHGPNGLIGTDHLDAECVARGVGERIGCMVAPTLAYGMSQHHLGFSGSVTLRPSTLIAMIGDVVHSLARHGFERFFFINGHGGNIATVTAAFDEVYAAVSMRGNESPIRCKMPFWGQGPRCHALVTELYGDSEGSHASASEVALAQVLPAAGDQARADVAQGRAQEPRLLRQRRLPPPLSGWADRLRPVAVDARARRTHLCRRGRGHGGDVRGVHGRLSGGRCHLAMIRFIARRAGLLLVTLFGISVFAFGLIHLIPGDPVMLMFGERNVSAAQLASLRHSLGLDRPLLVQVRALCVARAARQSRAVAVHA